METYAILLEGTKAPRVIKFTTEQGVERLDWFYNVVNCECIDIVHTSIKDTCLVVDDEALLKENPEINVAASLLYGVRTHGQPIVGRALLTEEKATPDGLECAGFSKVFADTLAKAIENAYSPFLNNNA